MANEKPSSLSVSEDITSWVQWIVEYMKDAQADCLDFRTVPDNGLTLDASNLRPIFDALVDSKITEIHFGNQILTDKVQHLSKRLAGTKVAKLNLSGCNLTAEDLLSLTAVFKDTQVTELDVSENSIRLENQQIESFAAHLANCHLKHLNFSGNGVVPFENVSALSLKLPDTQLTCLDLSGFFQASGYSSTIKRRKILRSLLSSLQYTAVTYLNLGSNGLSNTLAKAVSAVLEKTKLEKLDLSLNKLTDSGVDKLCQGLKRAKVTHLDLSYNHIKGKNRLGHCLKATKIVELNLSGNHITNNRIFSAPNFLENSGVNTLKLSDCFKSAPEIMLLLIRNLRFSELVDVDLSWNRLNLNHISALADALSNSKLTHINLSENAFSDQCLNNLGKCLNNSRLKHVNLDNVVTRHPRTTALGIAWFLEKSKGSPIVSVVLSDNDLHSNVKLITPVLANTTFLALNLADNLLEGHLLSLAEQLKFTGIVDLNLNSNCIRDDSAEILAKCLVDTKVIILDLCYNEITSVGAKALALALKNTKLRLLYLERNKIEDDGLESIAEHAKNSCIKHLCVESNPGNRTQIINRILWDNHKRIQQFADLLKRTACFTGDSDIFEFDRDFDGVSTDAFIEDCLKLYSLVSEAPYLVGAIEQDKFISDLQTQKCLASYTKINQYIDDCLLIYEKIVSHPSPVQDTRQNGDASFFSRQILWLITEKFPRKFVDFLVRRIEADLDWHISLLRVVEELGLGSIVELLLLNRPKYMIDESQGILHPYVYKLLHKYRLPICNLDIEPKGMNKIVEYFTKNIDLNGAHEVISLLSLGKLS